MIEARIKRALWAVSILTAFGFGGYGVYKLFDAYQMNIASQQWHDLNDKWYSETCGKTELDSAAGRVCSDAWRQLAYYRNGLNRARDEGATSLAVAVTGPVGLWSLFLLLRWIWMGKNKNSQPFVSPGLKISTESQAQTSMNWLGTVKGAAMKRISWKFVLTLLIGIPIVNIVGDYIGRTAAERVNEREANTMRAAPSNASIRTLVSSQDAEGITQQQMDLDFLKNLETYTVERATVKAKEHLAASGYPNARVHYTSEATYVESGPMKLALIRMKAEGTRQIFIAGIVGRELKRVLCLRESEESILVVSGPCADKIREVFGVSLGG